MKKILLIDIDSKIPNIALKKIEKFYIEQNNEVVWNLPIYATIADKIYVSVIFSKNRDKANQYDFYDNVYIGGSGWDLKTELPEEIYKINPKINIDFATRGCIRKCQFCVVPEKEGDIRIEKDFYDIWDGKTKDVMFLDNNILAVPEHFELICEQAQKEKVRIDFNQGMDFRLLNESICKILKKTKFKDYRFAFDNLQYEPMILEKIKLLNQFHIKGFWYVLVGYNSSFEEDLYKINLISSNNQRAFAMRHENSKHDRRYTALCRWTNLPILRNAMSFADFLKTDTGLTYKKEFSETNELTTINCKENYFDF